MSRNKEKAQAGLNRFQALKNKEAGVLESNPSLRPKYVQSVTSLPQAEKWRSTVLSEISVKLTRISDPVTNDFVLRELNESLNKLFREKRAWEYQIKSLGGNDYINFGKDLSNTGVVGSYTDESGKAVTGYRYFGRAKDLPDVKPLLRSSSQTKTTKPTNQHQDLLPNLYYGYFDELKYKDLFDETEMERMNKISHSFGDKDIEFQTRTQDGEDELLEFENKRSLELMKELSKQPKTDAEFTIVDFAKVIPSQSQVSEWVLDQKKKALLEKLGMNNETDTK
jgi:pre-mRNA-splicing factor ISY1